MTPADGAAGGIGRRHDKMARLFSLPSVIQVAVAVALCTAMVAGGVLLRTVTVLSPGLAAGLLAALTATPVIVSAVIRLADPDHGWAEQEKAHRQSLPVQLRCSLALDAIDDYLAAVRLGWWRSAHLALPLPAPGHQPIVSVYPGGNRLLVVVARDLLEEDPAQAVACVARVLAMARGWRFQLRAATLAPLRLGGLLVLGWAVGWPWLLAALAFFQVAMTAAGWLIELSADRYTLLRHGRAQVLEYLTPRVDHESEFPSAPHPRLMRWLRWVLLAAAAASSQLPPPARLRRALATGYSRDAAHDHA